MMRQFGDLESVVMDRLWTAAGPLTVRQVLEQLPGDKSRAYTTVMTVLDNLFRKGYVTRVMEGKAYRYLPAASREEHTAAVMEEILAGAGNQRATLLHFVEQMSAEEARTLRDALEKSAHGRDLT